MSETDEGGTVLSSTIEDEEPHAGTESLGETAVEKGRRMGVESWACHCADYCGAERDWLNALQMVGWIDEKGEDVGDSFDPEGHTWYWLFVIDRVAHRRRCWWWFRRFIIAAR